MSLIRRSLTTAALVASAAGALAFSAPAAGAATSQGGPLTLNISTNCPDMQVGSRGECVRALQTELVALGAVIDADGKYGEETAGAVRRIQERYSFRYRDGIAGPESREKIQGHYEEQLRLQNDNPDEVTDSACSNLDDVPFIGNSAVDACKKILSTEPAG